MLDVAAELAFVGLFIPAPRPQTVIDTLSALLVVVTLILVAHRSLLPAVRMYAIQSAILSILAGLVAVYTGQWDLLLLAVFTIGVKVVGIPAFLHFLVDRIRIKRESQPYIDQTLTLAIAGALILAAYWIVRGIQLPPTLLARHSLTASLAVVFIGFLIMATRRKAVSQTLGLLVMENGMFLAGLSLTYGMPLLVELGVAFDVLVAAIIVGILIFNINRTFDTVDASRLSKLAEGPS
ncbi:MAG: hydrogenase [Thermoplasmatota archaeon]